MKSTMNKLCLTMFSVGGALGVLVATDTPAQAQQAEITGAAVVDDGSGVSAVSGQVELAPGQELQAASEDINPVTITPNIQVIPDPAVDVGPGADFFIRDLGIDFSLAENNGASSLEQSIADAVSNAFSTEEGSPEAADVISLVRAFGSGVDSGEQGQASIRGAVAFNNDNIVTTVASEAVFAPGQQIAAGEGDEVTILPAPAEGLAFDFSLQESNAAIGGIEGAVADAVNSTFNAEGASPQVSDVISLVEAFNGSGNSSQQEQARVSGAAAFDNYNRLSVIAAQAELAPGKGLAAQNTLPNSNVLGTELAGTIGFITGNPLDRDNNVLQEGNLEFATTNVDSGGTLEQAIADAVGNVDTSEASDVISLVEAAVGGSEDTNIDSQVSDIANQAADVALD